MRTGDSTASAAARHSTAHLNSAPDSPHTAVPAARMTITETPAPNERLSVAEAILHPALLFILYSLHYSWNRFPHAGRLFFHASRFARSALSCTRTLLTSRPIAHPTRSAFPIVGHSSPLSAIPHQQRGFQPSLLSASFLWKRQLSACRLVVSLLFPLSRSALHLIHAPRKRGVHLIQR